MKIKGLKWIVTMSITLTLTGCEFFGLDMQESYEYDYKAGIPDNNVHMNAWDFIQSRLDIFSLLKDAVKYADMEELSNQRIVRIFCQQTLPLQLLEIV